MASRRASRCGNPRGIDAEFIRMIAHPAHRGLCVCNRVHDRRSVPTLDAIVSEDRHHAAERQMRCLRLESADVAENPASTEKEHNRRRLGAGLAPPGCEHVRAKVRVADALRSEERGGGKEGVSTW